MALDLELQLKLNERLVAPLKSAFRTVRNETKNVQREFGGLQRASAAWERLGVRSERQIRREIQLTQASYNRLARSGTISAKQLARAKDAELRKIRELNRELKSGLTLQERGQRLAQRGAALAAGAYVAKRAFDRPIDYDRQLALTANVAFADRSVAGRIAGKSQLNSAVRSAQKLGLGSQEEVLSVLSDLIGSGAMGDGRAGVQSSINLLPTIAQAATGTGASPQDIANIVKAGKQNMNMTDKEVKSFISKAIVAGNLGGFELRDMARFLPEQMALMAANGGQGMRGAEDLLAFNQVARINAGNADQAGNNVVNLLRKINSRDTARDFDNLGIDLSGTLANARGQGIGTLDAFLSLIDKVAGQDKEYAKLKALAAKQQGGEKQKTIEAMMAIVEQRGVGLTVQDAQAMSALLAARQQGAKLNTIRDAVRADAGGQVRANFAVVNASVSAEAERMANNKDRAAFDSLTAMEQPLKAMLEGINQAAEAHPVLAASAYSAATALGVLAASSGISGILGGGKGRGIMRAGKGLLGAARGGGGMALRGGAALLSGGAAATAGTAALGVMAAGAAGYGIGTLIHDNFIDGTAVGEKIGETVARVLAAFGNEEAKRALEINLSIDGEKVEKVVTKRGRGFASRH